MLKLDAGGNISDSCPSGIGQDTTVSPANTSVTPENSQATVSNTSCTVTSTSVMPQDTNAIIDSQCVLAWAMSFGGTNNDYASSVQQTRDSGYIVAGGTSSFGSGNSDFWVLKLEPGGCVQWQKTYGGTNDEKGYYIQQTRDGGYIVAGETQSFGAGHIDSWVLKLDAIGAIQWQKTYGGTSYETVVSIQQTADDGYAVAGYTYSFGAGGSDLWILKLAAGGDVEWQKTYGGANEDRGYDIQQTIDGGYIVAGSTTSFGGSWGTRFWVLKLDENGEIQWQKTYGSISDIARSIMQTADGGYIVAGVTWSFGSGGADLWILKLDANGAIQWQKTYGGAYDDKAYSIHQTTDYGYIVAGYAYTSGAGENWDFETGESDCWILKLDANGTILWQKTYGGTSEEGARFIQQIEDGGYIVAGTTGSFGAGGGDFWVLKLDAGGNISDSCPSGIGQDTTVSPANTSVTPENSQATVSNSSCTVTSTSVTPQNSDAVMEIQCYN